MRLAYLLVILCLVFVGSDAAFAKKKTKHAWSRQQTAMPIYGTSALSSEINRIISQATKSADVGVYVKSLRSGATLYSRNVSQPLAPASTMKILTAEAALLYLGSNYRFSTQLLTDAKSVKNGVLQGNLYIVLSGDPSLTYPDIVDLMYALREQQIHAIAGKVYIDNTAYDQRFYGPGWIWQDKGYCYAAPISASIINRNCLSFQMAPSKVGRPAKVVTSPNYFYPGIRNSVVTKGRSRACGLRTSTASNSWIAVDGCIGKNVNAWGVSYVVTDIPEYNRSLIKNLLNRLSIDVYQNVTFGSAPSSASIINTHHSEPLRELIHDMLKKSDNVIAGALFKKLGQLYTGKQGSWETGSIAVAQILAKKAGVDTAGLRILDGSGLSPDNLATAAQMMQVLNFAYSHDGTRNDFITALPIAGVDGTLKHRMGNIIRKIRAKTGTISGVVSLAGYAVSKDQEPLAFVIIFNGLKGLGFRYRSYEDQIATALTRYKHT